MLATFWTVRQIYALALYRQSGRCCANRHRLKLSNFFPQSIASSLARWRRLAAAAHVPAGRLLVVALPLVFAVQEALHLRSGRGRLLLAPGGQRGRLLAGFGFAGVPRGPRWAWLRHAVDRLAAGVLLETPAQGSEPASAQHRMIEMVRSKI